MSILHNPYKGDYDHVPEVDKKGRFRDRFFYIGDIYVLPFDENEKKKTYLPCITYGVLMLAAVLVQGLVNQTSSRTLWIVLPYFIQFLPILFYLVGVVEYVTATPRMTKPQYDKGIGRMHFCGAAVMVIAAISALCEVVYLVIRRGQYDIKLEIIYFLLHIPVILVGIKFGRYYNKHFSQITVESGK
ncbi:MAG: hypothetical protein E7301_02145 [Butyrivibrio sp.]|uniref:hypothetical protein n=1 Tax=Butyrivibrio sp. NC2002 TaxID=1410610 RepID=UPI000564BDF1|nr:hypothetical protein [Butyrivibrio sp. NC2002]MBE5858913.1 hypothetical protein [Butyrivibrio sp.]